MKFDKDTAIKYHYWIGLAFVPALIFFMVFWLTMTVASEITTKQDEIDKQEKALTAQLVTKNENVLRELEKRNTELNNEKNKVWEEAWNAQKDLMLWPEQLKELDKYPYGTNVDKINIRFREMYTQPQIYLSQFEQMKSLAEPTNYRGTWEFILDPKEWKTATLGQPTSEDLWIAQENIWVQRSMLRIIQDANDTVRIFKRVPPPAERKPLPRGVLAHETFTSPFWQLDLQLDKANLTASLKNISKTRQSRNVSFKVQVAADANARRVTIPFEGLPVGPADPPLQKVVPIGNIAAELIYGVEQALDKRTVPIKEIADLEMTWPANRFAGRLLRPHKQFLSLVSGTTAPSATPTPGAPAGTSTPYAAAQAETRHGFSFYRYLDTTEQVRRMSIAMVLIVDQTYMQDVLAAFSSTKEPLSGIASRADTKLRMQPTQMHWQHVPDNIFWEEDELKPDSPLARGATPPLPGASPGSSLVTPGRPGQTFLSPLAAEDERSNLVELTLYGILSLYERYSPTSPDAPPGTTPVAQGTTPAVPAPK